VLDRSLSVSDRYGTFSADYADIAEAKSVALGGVAIAFRDRHAWLASLDSGAEMRRNTSAVLRDAYDCDILIAEKELSVGGEAFLAMLRDRCGPAAAGG
jgi:hypothetical protein